MIDPVLEALDFTSYRVWTRLIGEHFFPVGAGAAPVHLALDDALATQIGRGFGGTVRDFEGAVSSIVDPDDEPTFLRALPPVGDHYGPLGLLAAQVLTATRMGSFVADAPTAFWAPFRHAFTGGRTLRPISLDTLDRFWHLAKEHYERAGRGSLAIQADPSNVPLAGKRHINLPLFQALLRATDRAQLRSWFRDNPDVVRLPVEKLVRHLVENAGSFNKKLTQTLRDAQANPQLAAAFAILVAEIVNSTGSAEPTRNRSAHCAVRLRLVGIRGLDCVLQRRDSINRWIDVSDALDDLEIRDGFEDEVSGARWRGDDRVLFVEGPSSVGFTSHHAMLNPGVAVVLLYLESDEDVIRSLRDTQTRNEILGSTLRAFRASRMVVTEHDDALLHLFDCRHTVGRSVRLEGGLSVGRVWLSSRPPTVMVNGVSHVMINERPYPVASDGEVRLWLPLSPGRYTVRAKDEQISFEIEDGAKLADSADGDEIVYALTPRLATSRIDEVTSGRYLVGAYLGEAPTC